jgi:hypothetical protein
MDFTGKLLHGNRIADHVAIDQAPAAGHPARFAHIGNCMSHCGKSATDSSFFLCNNATHLLHRATRASFAARKRYNVAYTEIV